MSELISFPALTPPLWIPHFSSLELWLQQEFCERPGPSVGWAPSAPDQDFPSCDLVPCLPAPLGQLADTCSVPSAAVTQVLLEAPSLLLESCPPSHGILTNHNSMPAAPAPSHCAQDAAWNRSPR